MTKQKGTQVMSLKDHANSLYSSDIWLSMHVALYRFMNKLLIT